MSQQNNNNNNELTKLLKIVNKKNKCKAINKHFKLDNK